MRINLITLTHEESTFSYIARELSNYEEPLFLKQNNE